MNLAVQRGFSLPAASQQARLVSALAGKVLPRDGQMSGVFCLKNVWLQMLACGEEKLRCVAGRGCSPVALGAGAGWVLGSGRLAARPRVGAGFAFYIGNFQDAGWKNTLVLSPASGWEG